MLRLPSLFENRAVDLAIVALVVALASSFAAPPPAPVAPAPCASQTHAFLEGNRAVYGEVLLRARHWLDNLRVDPIELRAAGIKGKKKLVELLDTYFRLWQIASGSEKTALLERIRRAAAVTSDPRYHDMKTVDDATFKEDATSYLRAAYLMDRLGLDTTRYRREIAAIKPRLDAQMARRGVHQRLAFHLYYRHFGLSEPFSLDRAAREGVIAGRRAPAAMSWNEAYDFTHEIFVPYEFGEKLDADPFTAADAAYIRSALETLIPQYIAKANPDLVGELVSCTRMVRLVERPVYRQGLTFLLESQNPDGSWGSVEWARGKYGEWAPQATLLHTTGVVVDALALAFHEPWNRDLFPGCR